MPSWAMLLVVVVRDPGLRGALAARLVLDGANLLTMASYREQEIERLLRRPAMLVTDESAITGDVGEWLDAEWQRGRWRRILMITVDSPLPENPHDWLTYVSRGSAADSIAGLLDDWSEQEGLVTAR